jgi:hypothetical protein
LRDGAVQNHECSNKDRRFMRDKRIHKKRYGHLPYKSIPKRK